MKTKYLPNQLAVKIADYFLFEECTLLNIGSGLDDIKPHIESYIKRDNPYYIESFESDHCANKKYVSPQMNLTTHDIDLLDSKAIYDMQNSLSCDDRMVTVAMSVLSMTGMIRQKREDIISSLVDILPKGGAFIMVEKSEPREPFTHNIFGDIDDGCSSKHGKRYITHTEFASYANMFESVDLFYSYLDVKGWVLYK